MSSSLLIEFLDTDSSSYKHRLELPLKQPGGFRVIAAKVLHVDHSDGTDRFVPLDNVKQYHERADGAHTHRWQLDARRGDEVTEESCSCGAGRQTLTEDLERTRITRITISEPAERGESEAGNQASPPSAAQDGGSAVPTLLVNELLRRFEEAGFEGTPGVDSSLDEKAGFLLEALVEAEITARET
jgi:hypothetical protein